MTDADLKKTSLVDKPFVKNIAYLWMLQVANYLPPLLVFPYLSRTLGAESFGVMNYAIAIVAYCVLITDWGFNLSASREIARNRHDSRQINEVFWNTLAAKAVLACLSLVGLSLAIAMIPSLRVIAVPLYAAWFMVVGNVVTLNWYFQGLEQMGKYALSSIAGKIALLPLVFLFVTGNGDAATAIWLQAFATIVTGLVSVYIAKSQKMIERPSISFRKIAVQLSGGSRIFLSTAAINIYTTSNVVFLGAMTDLRLVGLFAGADKIRYAVSGLATPFSTAVYPRISRMMLNEKSQGMRLAGLAFLVQLALFLPICMLLHYFSEDVVLLILGDGFTEAADILRILAWVPLVTCASNSFGIQMLLPLGANTIFSRIVLASALVNLAFIIPMVHFYAAKGVAWTILFTECFTALVMGIYAFKFAFFSPKEQEGE